MTLPYVFVTSLAISMATISLMTRLAPRLGMIDLPDSRKVHAQAVPRVGGIGIFLGAIASIILWIPLEPWMWAYLAGALVIFAFGAWDDSREMGHYFKFVGQLIAACGVVFGGELWISKLPFVPYEVSAAFGQPFTVFALVGMINAINHSDGLDGLAGGESLLSLACLAYFGLAAGAAGFVLIIAAIVGGVFGFLRFNTHPAGVFMGDSGSQFLGFSLGVLAIVLTQKISPTLSMAIPLLILGLPIIDILAVLAQRISQGMNWFRATKNHIHHRLLALGFEHYQAVTLIYSVQATLALSSVSLAYESDGVVAGAYAAVCGLVFGLISYAERRRWSPGRSFGPFGTIARGELKPALRRLPIAFVQVAIPAYLLIGGILVTADIADFGVAAAAIVALSLASIGSGAHGTGTALGRFVVYSGAACVVSLLDQAGKPASGLMGALDVAFFVLLAIAVGAAIRLDPDVDFQTTPLDFLLVFAVLAVGLLAQTPYRDIDVGGVILRVTTLFYGCELLIASGRRRAVKFLELAVCVTAILILVRAVVGA